ncbi:alpha/beta hydrolase [Blastococcus sp. PRF04-17]|nr:alpha/beta hydrolase [Blastococcus sp. PRF04-17]UOY03175.1 alpha/beta hydrolase [Blastococcus sp. PRF04-17]
MVLPARRGTPPSPPAEGNDFAADAEDIAELIDAPTHVVAHSYGCIGTLLAVAKRPGLVATLTLVEPPAYQLLASDAEALRAMEAFEELRRVASPEEFLPAFLQAFLGAPAQRIPLDPSMRRLVELTMRERPPWTAELPLFTLRDAGTPILIVSGGHARLFEACADALAEELAPHAVRAVIRGAGHAVQRLGEPFNAALERFWREARIEEPRQGPICHPPAWAVNLAVVERAIRRRPGTCP